MASDAFRPLSDVVRLTVRLTPRGSADRIEGVSPDGVLRARVRAAPVDGAANEALLRLLTRELGIARSSLVLERGQTGRLKVVRLEGPEADDLLARWPELDLRS